LNRKNINMLLSPHTLLNRYCQNVCPTEWCSTFRMNRKALVI
jgi:hypothetical protein